MDNPLDVMPEETEAPDPPPPESTLPQWSVVREAMDWRIVFTLEHKRQRGSDANAAAMDSVKDIAAAKGLYLVADSVSVSTTRIDGDEIIVKATAKLEV